MLAPFGLFGALVTLLHTPSVSAFAPLGNFDTIFAFGDSYTASGFNASINYDRLSPNQTIYTCTGGKNWIQFLAEESVRPLRLYDLAVGGATVDRRFADAFPATGIKSFVDQVEIYEKNFPAGGEITWSPDTTLFTVWFGINDNALSTVVKRNFTEMLPGIMTNYTEQLTKLYNSGARNFVIPNLPPIDLSPIADEYGPEAEAEARDNVATWNAQLPTYIANMPTLFPGSQALLYDSHSLFMKLLDAPASYGFKDWTTVCPEYSSSSNATELFIESCKYPLAEYFWHDAHHPSFPVHHYIAQDVTSKMNGAAVAAQRLRSKNRRRSGARRVDQYHH